MKKFMTVSTLMGLAGLAMPAFGQFGGFGEILMQEVDLSSEVFDLEGGDINGDGLEDIVYLTDTGAVFYYEGFDNGLFDGPLLRILESDGEGRSIKLYDYDGDGDLDLIRSSAINTGDVRVFRNNGSGDFSMAFAVTGVGELNNRDCIELGDFDGDGNPDIFTVTATGVAVIKSTGTGFSTTPLIFEQANFTGRDVAVGDIDGDGRADAVATSTSNNNVYVLRSEGDDLVEVDRFSPGVGIRSIELVDIDLDGDLDILVLNNGSPASRVSIYRNDGAGNFDFAYALTLIDPEQFQVVDIDGDGDLDILVEAQLSYYDPETIVVYLNNGLGYFDRQITEWTTAVDFSSAFAAIDIDPDTGPALVSVFGNYYGHYATVRLNQTPFFAPTAPALLTPANGATNLAPPAQVSAWGGQTRPQVSWERSEGFGVTYSVVVSRNPGLSSPVFVADGLTGRTADLSGADLRPGTRYYWSVFADNPRGSTGPVGGPFSFTTAASGVTCQADFDGDGELTIFDFLAFTSAFDAGCP